MSSVVLVVVHGCPRIKQVEVDQKIRGYLRQEAPIVVSFPPSVALRPEAIVIEVTTSFYPGAKAQEYHDKLAALVTERTKLPATIFVHNRHPTALHQAVSEVIRHEQSVGKLR